MRYKLKPSMKDRNYSVGLILGRSNDNTSILRATCQCVAGYVNFLIAIILYLTGCIYIVKVFNFSNSLLSSYRNSASCTHVSAVLHSLVALTSNEFQLQPDCSQPVEEDDDQLPVTSYPCQWI